MDNTSRNTKKTDFQNSVKEIESSLAKYKTSFPKNFGDMFRNKVAAICAMFALYCILSVFAFYSFGNVMKAVFVSLAMFFAAILLSYAPKPDATKDDVKSKRQSLKSMEEYPDVQKYAEDVDAELDRVENEKKSYKKKMNIIYYAYLAVLVGFLVHSFVTDNTYLRDDLENIHADDNCGDFSKAAEFFNLQPKTPFAVIRPFDSGQTPSDIQLFIVNINEGKGSQAGDCLVAFRFATPEIKNSNQGDNYTITITDEQGRPSCVSFQCIVGADLVQKRISQTEHEAMNICNYIHNHAQELRYTVEK